METSRIETNKSENTIKPVATQTATPTKDTSLHDTDKKESEKTPSVSAAKNQIRAVTKSDWISDVSHQAEDMNQGIQSFLKKNPIVAVAVAVGIGFAGSLVMKKLSARKAEDKA